MTTAQRTQPTSATKGPSGALRLSGDHHDQDQSQTLHHQSVRPAKRPLPRPPPRRRTTPALLVLGFDEQQKPCGARFVGDKPDLVAKAAQLMGLKVYKATSPMSLTSPRSCRSAGSTPTAAGSCRTCGKPSTATSIVALAAEPQQAAVGTDDDKASTPVARGLPRKLGRDRAWPSRHRPREPRLRVVGGDRDRPQRRHAHAAVPRLPAAAQVLSASQRHRADEPCQRSDLGFVEIGSGCDSGPSPLPAKPGTISPPSYNLEVLSWTRRLRAFAR